MKSFGNSAALKVAVLANSAKEEQSGLTTQTLDDKYVIAVSEGCGAIPIVLPTLLDKPQIDAMLDMVDGVMLTGDLSNIAPEKYGVNGDETSHGPFDRQRDETALYLIKAARERRLPILGICRGMQEINVAMGGSLQNNFIGNAAFPDHPKYEKSSNPETTYGEAHPVSVELDTRLGKAIGEPRVRVNSVHVQAVEKLGDGLVAVATSDDGIVEAFEHNSDHLIIGVQWHAEYRAMEHPVSMAVFACFAEALQDYKNATNAKAEEACG